MPPVDWGGPWVVTESGGESALRYPSESTAVTVNEYEVEGKRFEARIDVAAVWVSRALLRLTW